jgi:hypothetical protein
MSKRMWPVAITAAVGLGFGLLLRFTSGGSPVGWSMVALLVVLPLFGLLITIDDICRADGAILTERSVHRGCIGRTGPKSRLVEQSPVSDLQLTRVGTPLKHCLYGLWALRE